MSRKYYLFGLALNLTMTISCQIPTGAYTYPVLHVQVQANMVVWSDEEIGLSRHGFLRLHSWDSNVVNCRLVASPSVYVCLGFLRLHDLVLGICGWLLQL